MANQKKNIPLPPEFIQRLVKAFCAAPELQEGLARLTQRELAKCINKAGIEFDASGRIVVFDWTGEVIFSQPLEKLVKEQLNNSPRRSAAAWKETSATLRKLADRIDRTMGIAPPK